MAMSRGGGGATKPNQTVATSAYLALVEITKLAFYRFVSRRQTDAAR